MSIPKMKRTPAARKAPSLDAAIVEIVREQLAELGAAPFEWVRWSEWARSPEHARRLAEREGVRLTKLGRDIYGHRADLDALAARNAVDVSRAEEAEIDPDVAEAFGARRSA